MLTSRRKAREEAFKMLFQIDVNEDIEPNFVSPFTERIVQGVIEHKDKIDRLIEKYLINWTLERISLVDKTLLRMAIYEICFEDDVPFAVSINEAVELAHKYGDEKSGKFINGVLSNIIKKGDTI
ncbi:MAG: transcription antitermination factor NusB [Bacilli bacterium]|nr:transcription antitermination factor NusB [Bacilli bacterium]